MSAKLIYSHENLFMVQTAKAHLERQQLLCFLKNEHSAIMGGELGAANIWAELWLADGQDQAEAERCLAQLQTSPELESSWRCHQCGEENGSAFEFCWACQTQAK